MLEEAGGRAVMPLSGHLPLRLGFMRICSYFFSGTVLLWY